MFESSPYDLISVVGIDTQYDGAPFDSVSLNGIPLTEEEDYTVVYTAKADADDTTGGEPITHRFELGQIAEAFRFAHENRDKVIKAVVMNHE